MKFDGRTLVESVTAYLRDEIIQGKREPGVRLSQEELAEEFGVSRIPIREALRQLAAEGLVTLHPRRGAFVSEMTRESGEELLAIAGALEGVATRRGAERITPEGLRQMKALLAEMPKYERRPLEWYELNQEFHMILVRAAGWSRLAKLIDECRVNLVRHIVRPQVHLPTVKQWHKQHVAIYEACASGDSARTLQLFDAHWRYSSEVLLVHAQATTSAGAPAESGSAGQDSDASGRARIHQSSTEEPIK